MGWLGLGGLAEGGFLVLPEIVHVEIAVGSSQFSWVSRAKLISSFLISSLKRSSMLVLLRCLWCWRESL
jgi:hypothetical protein